MLGAPSIVPEVPGTMRTPGPFQRPAEYSMGSDPFDLFDSPLIMRQPQLLPMLKNKSVPNFPKFILVPKNSLFFRLST